MTAADRPLDPFYPIVPDIRWLERLLPCGIRTVQLRLKDAPPAEVLRQVAAARDMARAADCQLIINDHWRAAIDASCDWLHLGQEDLAAADLSAIRRAGLRLGISTHSHEELSVALAAKPDYVALGPIWETKLKAMTWPPQGLGRLREWKQRIGALPLVAIAGITPERAPAVMEAGAQSCAVITDFITHASPEARVRQWMEWSRRLRGGLSAP